MKRRAAHDADGDRGSHGDDIDNAGDRDLAPVEFGNDLEIPLLLEIAWSSRKDQDWS
ncbi:hypothetical protein U1Q18_049952 [Sarracenia purpurea var. burkii]